jgi:hypothetical protein
MQPTRKMRLMRIITRINEVHCKRRILGKPTAHLYSRSRTVTSAYLDTINQPES